MISSSSSGLQCPGFGLGRADGWHQAGQDLDLVRVAADTADAGLQVGVELLRVAERLLGGEHRLGVPGGELPAVVRRARLDQERAALRRPGHVERPADLEELALVVDLVDAAVVGVDARRLVAEFRAVLPAVPQPDRHVGELGSPAVALGVGPGCRRARSSARPPQWPW